MSGPARAGLFVYAVNPAKLVTFYQEVANMRVLHERDDLTVLESPDIQLLVHRIPDHIARDIPISVPPLRREDTALKFFFTVPSLGAAAEAASRLGGELFDDRWQGPGFVACNGMDPEGNVFQLRESAA